MENGAKPDQRVAVAVENRGDVAGATRLAVVPHASTQGLTSFARGVIDAREARVHTEDGWQAYAALARQGVVHRPRSRGTARGPARSSRGPTP
jgi:hypothetical protein